MVKVTQDLIGVLIPTILIMVLVYFPWEARVLYQNLFHRSWLGYIKRMGVYTCINLVGAAACWFLCLQLAPSNSLVTFVVRLAVIGAVFPLIWLITTHRTDEFNAMLDIARRFVKKRGES